MTTPTVEKRTYLRSRIRCHDCRQWVDPCYADLDVCATCHTENVARAIDVITTAVLDAVEAMSERTTCMACGCLVLLDEHCPGCRVRRTYDDSNRKVS